MEARYYITISPDEELHTYTRQAEDGATVVLITAPTFEAAAGAYLAFTGAGRCVRCAGAEKPRKSGRTFGRGRKEYPNFCEGYSWPRKSDYDHHQRTGAIFGDPAEQQAGGESL